MDIKFIRIDDRLIHGQIVTAWINYTGAAAILVADDKAADDSMQKNLLKMACPSSVKLVVSSVDEAVKKIEKSKTDTSVFLIVRSVESAKLMIDSGIDIKSINVGNINLADDRTRILSNLWPTQKEAADLRTLEESGVELDVRTVPTDKRINLIKLMSEAGI